MTKQKKPQLPQEYMPTAEEVQAELAKVQSMDDFFGKEGVFARLFASTLEQMLEDEMTEHLGYEPYEAAGRNSGNNRNGHYLKKVRTSTGETSVQVPRDRNGQFEPQIISRYAGNTNELEEKILAMYARGMSTRDIAGTLAELYGVDITAATISTITEKVWPLVRSAARLRKAAPGMGLHSEADIGVTFIDAVNQGLVTANPPDWGDPPDPNGVVLSTIYAYLLAGQPARVQVWLETSAQGWWDIPRQPLSNAFVLAQSRSPDIPWTIDEEFAVRNELLTRIVRGLTARCREGIILATSDLDRRGVRQDGPLWRALGPLVRQKSRAMDTEAP